MTTMKITIEDMGVTKTYEKDFGNGGIIFVGDYFEACLEAYNQQGYQNSVDVDIYGLAGNVTQTVSWDKDNHITNDEQMDVADDLMSFVELGEPQPGFVKDFKITMGGEDVSHMFKQSKENWYMGHCF